MTERKGSPDDRPPKKDKKPAGPSLHDLPAPGRDLFGALVDLADYLDDEGGLPGDQLRPDRRLTAAAREQYALALRLRGADYDEIARLCGWKNRGNAHRAVTKALARRADQSAEEVEQLRALELARLDKLTGAAVTLAELGSERHAGVVMAAMDRRRKLVPGLEVPPPRQELGLQGGPLTVVFQGVPEPEYATEAVPEDQLGVTPT